MKMKLFACAVCSALLTITGCVGTLDGKHQGGVPFVSDTVEGVYERPFDLVWKACRDTLTYNGTPTVENVIGHTFEAKVDNRTVWVLVENQGPNLTRIAIQVRTSAGGTDKDLATQLREQIAVRLAGGGNIPTTPPPKAKATK